MSNPFENWKKTVEDLEKSLSSQIESVSDDLEKKKSELKTLIHDTKEKLDEIPVKEKIQKYRAELEDLQVQLALGKAESREAFEEQKKKLDQNIHEASAQYQEARKKLDHEYHHLIDEVQHQVEHLQGYLEMLNLQFHLGKADFKDEWENQRNLLQQKLKGMKDKVHDQEKEMSEESKEKWSQFSEEMSAAYRHFRKGLSDLF